MKTAFFDCFSGISGDMCLGALVDAGVDFGALRKMLGLLPVGGYTLRCAKVMRSGISATSVHVEITSEQPERHLPDIEQIINASKLPDQVKNASREVFTNLARAEAKIHATTPEKVHFHEVGAVDAIIDVVGTMLGLHLLGVEMVLVSPLPMGRGFIKCAHGVIPSPAPATLEILVDRHISVYGTDMEMELVTPTGAALVATLNNGCGTLPVMQIKRVGYGAGKKEYQRPNLLRLIIGEADDKMCPDRYNMTHHGLGYQSGQENKNNHFNHSDQNKHQVDE